MKNNRQVLQVTMIVALSVALSLFFIIPVPATNGFVTLLDVGIYTGAFLLGGPSGFFIGAFAGGLIDLLSGYPQWMIFSFIIHGLQGALAGWLFQKEGKFFTSLGFILGSLEMIIGYFLATWFLYTWPAALASLPGNIMQNVFGIGVTLLIAPVLKKILVKK